MNNEEIIQPKKTSDELAVERTDLAGRRTGMAVERSRLAHERTLMAWIRTSVSLISFGFTIYKFFQYFIEKGVTPAFGFVGPREIGIYMLILGFVSILLATIQHQRDLKILKQMNPEVKVPKSLSTWLAYFIILLSLFLLIIVLFKQ